MAWAATDLSELPYLSASLTKFSRSMWSVEKISGSYVASAVCDEESSDVDVNLSSDYVDVDLSSGTIGLSVFTILLDLHLAAASFLFFT